MKKCFCRKIYFMDIMTKFPYSDRKEFSDMICHIKIQMYDFEKHLENLRILFRNNEENIPKDL